MVVEGIVSLALSFILGMMTGVTCLREDDPDDVADTLRLIQ